MGLTAVTYKTTCLSLLLLLLVSGSASWTFSYRSEPPHAVPVDSTENRIVSGNDTTIEKYPYQLALEGGGRHICGASILSTDWALTAAHCVYDQPVKWLAFRAGSSRREEGGTVHPVKYYVYHKNFTKESLDYDVAVVSVKVPFVYNRRTLPVALPVRPFIGGDKVVVTGWGYLQQQLLTKPRLLQMADLVALDWEECNKRYPGQITERMLCAGDPALKKDICSGDSGGPLMNRGRVQVGIVSWAYKCADDLPSVYTNVSNLVSWIRKEIGFDDQLIFID